MLPSPPWQRAALAALMVLYVAHATRYGDWLIDDAGITFAYAQNIAAGNGPVINVGEPPVEGYSNPSWTFVLALFSATHTFVSPWTPKIVAGCFNLAAMVLAWRASRRAWGEPPSVAHLLAPALMAGVPSFVKYTMSGLENGIYVFSIVAAYEAQLREREKAGWSGGLFTFLTVIGRPEGIAYALVLGVDRVATAMRTRSAAGLYRWALGLGVPLGLYAGWHATTFQDWLPNTYYAKMRDERSVSELLAPHGRTRKYVDTFFSDHVLYWAPVAAALALTAPRRWLAASGLALFGAVGVAFSFPVYAGGDWMPQHRLFSPLYPLLGLAAAGGLTAPVLGRLPGWARAAVPMVALTVFAATIPAALERATSTRGMRLDVQMKVLDTYTRWADQLGLDRAVIGLADVGGASMTTSPRFELVDLNGLIDRRIAHLRRDLLTRGTGPVRDYVFREKRPDFLNYPEALYRLYELADEPAARDDWWVFNNVDAAGRFGTFVRRDLVEGAVHPGLAPVPVATGVRATARFEAGKLELWWAVDAPVTALPQAALTWANAAGEPVRTDLVKPFDGVFGPRLLQPGRVLHEVWRDAPPANAAVVSIGPAKGAIVAEAAPGDAPGETAVGGAVGGEPGRELAVTGGAPGGAIVPGSVPEGDFEGDGSSWTSIPAAAPGWGFDAEGSGKVLRVDLTEKGPLVCGPWAPLPPNLRVAGRARAENIVRGDKPWKSAGVTLRVKRADNTQHFPTLRAFEGSFDWKPFQAEYTAAATDAQYRLCVGGTGGSGRLWVDDLGVGG